MYIYAYISYILRIYIYIHIINIFIYIYIYIFYYFFFFDIYYCLTVTGTVLLDKSERTKWSLPLFQMKTQQNGQKWRNLQFISFDLDSTMKPLLFRNCFVIVSYHYCYLRQESMFSCRWNLFVLFLVILTL